MAVFLDQRLHSGGGYQQSLNALLLTKKIDRTLCELIYVTTVKENLRLLDSFNICAHFLDITSFKRLCLIARNRIQYGKLFRMMHKFLGSNYLEGFLEKHDVDLVYFTSPSEWMLYLEKINYIATNWDLCHRDYPEFPEVRENREFEIRERVYRYVLPKAIAVLADSELGKSNLLKRYCLDEGRIHVMRFSPSIGVRTSEEEYDANFFSVSKKYSLKQEYIFYPAQFWAHKNHAYILRAIKILEDKYNIKIEAIFSGGDAGNMNFIKLLARQLNIDERVHFIGFVKNSEIPYLYRQSLALVMPTYFGPTNLPPMEAFALDVPVIYSDLPGLKDQVKDAALLVDLNDPERLSQQIKYLMDYPQIRSELSIKGRKVLEAVGDSDHLALIEDIIRGYISKLSCWK